MKAAGWPWTSRSWANLSPRIIENIKLSYWKVRLGQDSSVLNMLSFGAKRKDMLQTILEVNRHVDNIYVCFCHIQRRLLGADINGWCEWLAPIMSSLLWVWMTADIEEKYKRNEVVSFVWGNVDNLKGIWKNIYRHDKARLWYVSKILNISRI